MRSHCYVRTCTWYLDRNVVHALLVSTLVERPPIRDSLSLSRSRPSLASRWQTAGRCVFFWHSINKTLQLPNRSYRGWEGLVVRPHTSEYRCGKARYGCSHKCQSDGMDAAQGTGEMTSEEYSMNFDFFFFFVSVVVVSNLDHTLSWPAIGLN